MNAVLQANWGFQSNPALAANPLLRYPFGYNTTTIRTWLGTRSTSISQNILRKEGRGKATAYRLVTP